MMKFFKCNDSDSLVIPVTKCFTDENAVSGAKEISPNTVEASQEKHLPVVNVSGNTVTVNVGAVAHPMTEEHSITSVILETQKGGQYQFLPHDGEPVAKFDIASGDKVIAAYAYCNLHGLWKTDID